MNIKTLVLCDIDGTLLDTRGAGKQAFCQALEEVFGWEDDLSYINFAGNTDLNVLHQVMHHHQHTMTEVEIVRFFKAMPNQLEACIGEGSSIIYPGVQSLIERLSDDSDIVLGLVTGNIESCAYIKLRQFDLHDHFVLGAFGEQFAERQDIAREAVELAKTSLKDGEIIGSRFMIGDTPFDVDAGRSIGAVNITVATGKFEEADLTEAGSDYVFSDLSDVESVLGLILPNQGQAFS